MAVAIGLDPRDLTQVGWGVVFPADQPGGLQASLEPLLAHRRAAVGQERFQILDYRPGESSRDWLRRHGVTPASVEPEKVPLYLLLVGGFVEIPLEFQRMLSFEYAVGRLVFSTPAKYRSYAESVVAYETAAEVPNTREVAYWAPRHEGDPVTQALASQFVEPLYAGSRDDQGGEEFAPIARMCSFGSRLLAGPLATKAGLLGVLRGDGASAVPALLVAASHGLGVRAFRPVRFHGRASLLCQDWPGHGPVDPSHMLSSSDLDASVRLRGVVAFLQSSFSALIEPMEPEPVRPGSLASRMLSHEEGGAARGRRSRGEGPGFHDARPARSLGASPVSELHRTGPVGRGRRVRDARLRTELYRVDPSRR